MNKYLKIKLTIISIYLSNEIYQSNLKTNIAVTNKKMSKQLISIYLLYNINFFN